MDFKDITYERSTAAYPRNIHDELDELCRVEKALTMIGTGSLMCHQREMGEALIAIAGHIAGARESLLSHLHTHIDDQFKAAQQGSATVLKAVLAGVKLAETKTTTSAG